MSWAFLKGGWMGFLVASVTGCVRVADLPSTPDAGAGGVDGPRDGGSALSAACQEAQLPRERATACLTLAGYLDEGAFGLPKDPGRAATLRARAVDTLQASCALGVVSDCTRAASVIGAELRAGGDASPVAAESAMWMKHYAEDGCRGGDASGCALLGVMYEEGLAVSRDLVKSAAHFDEACSGGHRRSCLLLAERAEGRSARRLYERACDAGSGYGCAAAGQLHRTSSGPSPNVDQVVYLARGCAMGDPASCVLGAEAYWNDEKRDLRGAASFAQTGCDRGIPDACWQLGQLLEHREGARHDGAASGPTPRRPTGARHDGAASGPTPRRPTGALHDGAASGPKPRSPTGAPKSGTNAHSAYQKACEGGLEKACAAIRPQKQPRNTGVIDDTFPYETD